MVEILFRCGTGKHAVVVSLGGFVQDLTEGSAAEQKEVLMTLICKNTLIVPRHLTQASALARFRCQVVHDLQHIQIQC